MFHVVSTPPPPPSPHLTFQNPYHALTENVKRPTGVVVALRARQFYSGLGGLILVKVIIIMGDQTFPVASKNL